MGKPVAKLIGCNGNIFVLVGKAAQVLRSHGLSSKAKEMQLKVLSAGSYDEALAIIMEYVEVE